MYIYFDNSVPLNTIQQLTQYRSVSLVNMTDSSINNKMSWRFLVAADTDVERYVVRDIDSRLFCINSEFIFGKASRVPPHIPPLIV
jgi:hypothetical protein